MDRPESFYKYTGVSGGKALLSSGKLKWSRPSEFNDPFDIQIDLLIGELDEKLIKEKSLEHIYQQFSCDKEVGPEDLIGSTVRSIKAENPNIKVGDVCNTFALGIPDLIERLPSVVEKYEPEIKTLMGTTKVLCLSELKDDLLMWAHYADSHKGMVFEFTNIPELDSPYSISKAVKYENTIPISYGTQAIINMICGNTLDDKERMLNNFIYTKSEGWSYEKEWRISTGEGRDPHAPFEYAPFGSEELRSVYFGCKMLEEDKQELIQLISHKYPHVKIFQAQKVYGKFALEFKELEV